jgi:hypothetical protein
MPLIRTATPEMTGDFKKDFNLLYDAYVALKRELEYLLTHLNQDNIQNVISENGDTIFDRKAFNNTFAKWFKNLCQNSNFELFDPDTLEPFYWTGGEVTPLSSFYGTFGLMLAPTETCVQEFDSAVNPSWYEDISEITRVSFYKKGGAVKVYVLDRDTDNPYTVIDKFGNEGTFIEFATNTNWNPEMYSVTCVPTGATRIKVKFENSDVSDNAYIDAVIIEPDYNKERPSLYTDGPYSAGAGNISIEGTGSFVKSYYDTNEVAVNVTDSETLVVEKTFTMAVNSNIFIAFSAEIEADVDVVVTAKTYVTEPGEAEAALDYQPSDMIRKLGLTDEIVFEDADAQINTVVIEYGQIISWEQA